MSGVARRGAPAEAAARPYAGGVELLMDLLATLDGRLQRMVEEAHGRLGAGEDPGLRGLVITDAEVARLLRPRASQRGDGARGTGGPLWELAAERIEASRREGVVLPLEVVRHRFGLSDFETDCVVACLAPELDPRYERLYGYLNDDVTRRYPTVHLLLELLCPPGETPVSLRRHLAPEAPLLRGRLLERLDDGRPPAGVSLTGRCLRVEEGVAGFLLHEGGVSADVQALWHDPAWPPQAARLWDELPARRPLEAALDSFFGPAWPAGDRLVCVLAGRAGSGRAQAAEAACARRGLRLLPLDCRRLLRHEHPEVALARAFRDSMLNAAPLLLADAHLLAEDRERGPELRLALERLVAERGWLLFLSVADVALVRGWFAAHRRVEIEIPLAPEEARARQWATLLEGEGVPADEAEGASASLAARFRLTPGKAAEAVQHAAGARLHHPAGDGWRQALGRSAARVSAPKLGELAQRIDPLYRWGDIVLPDAKLDLLRDVLRHVGFRRTVMEEWCFAGTMSRGRGLNVLFSGPPGTGKTMAAEIVAGELGLELYRIDLATVVSKYIGETEKNLAAIFNEAQHSDCILFFDEADALFGKRSEVRDAHDRYANIEINYLLQQMESYEGIAVLATNLRQNLDEAFLRRIHISVDFPLPGPEERLRIWRAVLPKQAPRADDLDLPHLALAFDLTGGNIRNVALAAAYLAAEAGQSIGMAHLVRATHRELEKIGKRCVREQFGPYFHLLEPAPAPAPAAA
ncbi:MAG TPA: ATP-binding protein [Longimicrobiaceae bacterium]|nr:ATP-binding protein [Longimicrobiaceae bacterium]